MREQGFFPYLAHIVPKGVPLWLYPLLFPIELIGLLTKTFALCIRLFANMMAGHVIVGLLYAAVFIGAPVVGMLFEGCITAPIQAFVFSLLTMVYLGGAVLAEEEH